ncbi:MAG: SMC-Scp complex subunit ScpB [Polyangia bacterium]|jgi:segregation and condensation protein B
MVKRKTSKRAQQTDSAGGPRDTEATAADDQSLTTATSPELPDDQASQAETSPQPPDDQASQAETSPQPSDDQASPGQAPLPPEPRDDPTGQPANSGDPDQGGAQTVLPFALGQHEAKTGQPAGQDYGQTLEVGRMESIIESLLFASDKALGLSELKRLLGERDGKKISAALESLTHRRSDSGIQVVALATGWHLRTHADNAPWVSKLLTGKPVKLSRAMMESLAIVAYRQPVTRPEIDDIRGVDCGPVLANLLDRGLVRIIGKKEEVGRPLLYGTTPEFLRVFNLRDLSELPTLREFYDLSPESQARVEAEQGEPKPSATTPKPDVALNQVARGALAPEPDDSDPLLDELDQAANAANAALNKLSPQTSSQEHSDQPTQPAEAQGSIDSEEVPHDR